MKTKILLGMFLIYALILTSVQAKVVLGESLLQVTNINNTIINQDEEQIGLLSGILQGIEDLFTADTQDDDGYCQILIDNNETFDSPEINRRVWVTDYTHDEYLNTGNYFIKVRCRENDRWGFWTDTEVHTHNNQQNTIYVDWSF